MHVGGEVSLVPTYQVAARRSRAGRGPLPPWHAVEVGDPPHGEGEPVVSLCGVPGLHLFAQPWEGLVAANGCRVCRLRAGAGPAG